MKPIELVITRHAALIELLIERGLTTPETLVLDHATIEDVRDKHVAGVLPFDLAAAAYAVTQIPLATTPEDRGKELSIERLREIAGPDRAYVTREVVHGYWLDRVRRPPLELSTEQLLQLSGAELLELTSENGRTAGAWRSK